MSRLTDEELLEILNQPSETQESPQPESNLPLFLSTFGLEEGTLKIPLKLVYRLYKLWSKEKLPEDTFYTRMSLLLPNKAYIRGITCYLLNQNTIKISESIFKLVKTKKKPDKTHFYKKNFDLFLKSCNIEKGSDWISVLELRSIYHKWAKPRYKQIPIAKIPFRGFCKLYFDSRGNPIEVAVNKKVINVPKEEAVEAEKGSCETKSEEE
jgi:hypothetical protein